MEKGERIIQAVLSQQDRSKNAAEEIQTICDKYKVTQVIVEVRQNGQTVQLGVQWTPVELIQQQPGKIQLVH
jgi:hypothetical protein